MTNVFLGPDKEGGEVWIHVNVVGVVHWRFTMELEATANIPASIPPVQNGPTERPLGLPSKLLAPDGASWGIWHLKVWAISDKKQDFKVLVRIYQVNEKGTKTYVYAGPGAHADPATAQPVSESVDPSIKDENPRTFDVTVQFLWKI